MVNIIPHYINGQMIIEKNKPQSFIYNPALGEVIGQTNFANAAVCEDAIASAKRASIDWGQTPAIKRVQVLFKFRDLLEKNKLDLARIVTQEHGKTLDDAKGSIARAIEVVEFNCGMAATMAELFSANVTQGIDCYTMRQPLGVCVGISPFNFPVMVPVWMMIPAIACGNTFILKPSEQNPSAPLRLVELLTEAGLPAGVVNCLQGDKKTVDYLLKHPDIAAVTAVASTSVAQSIYRTATAHGKRAHTFGGAKNHAVVMPDANVRHTAQAIVGAAFGSAGERCMAISVVVAVGEQTALQLITALKPLITAIRVDEGETPACDMGPLISQAHRLRVLDAIKQGVDEGATLLIDGRNFQHPKYPNGFFLGPCLFDHVTQSMSIYQKELFGPVLTIVRVDNFEQALDLVNHHQYGNGSAIFTQNGHTAREYCHRVQVGMVGVNIAVPVPIASHPFGGWKQSSFGDTNMHGKESIHFYTKRKTITSKWPEIVSNENAFNMPTFTRNEI